jgi:FkbM family methyltransferase
MVIGDFHYNQAEKYLIHNLCNKNEISIDVGAARGDFSVEMSKFSKRVISIEPYPLKILTVASSIENLDFLPCAASSVHGEMVKLRLVKNTPANSTIEHNNKLEGFENIEELDVKTVALDQVVQSKTSFIKIDCEGHDLEVLKGGINTITQYEPSILIELRDKHNPGYLKSTFELLLGLNYTAFEVLEDTFIELSKDRNNIQAYLNLLISSQEQNDRTSQENFLFIKRLDHYEIILNHIKKFNNKSN